MGRRILLTGLDTFWGGRVAAALERDTDVEMLLGMGTGTPSVELERTEYVRADSSYSLLSRIVQATHVDTIVHTFLVVDSSSMSGRALHEINVIGTMNLLAAAAAPGSSVRHVVVKSSSLVYGAHPADPAWFTEDTPRSRPARSRLERSLTEVESYVRDFAEENPAVTVSLLRFANVLGREITTPISRNLARGVMPCIGGFDPLIQDFRRMAPAHLTVLHPTGDRTAYPARSTRHAGRARDAAPIRAWDRHDTTEGGGLRILDHLGWGG